MKKIAILLTAIILISCNKNNEKADAYGNFEATEITVSSESNGKIEFLNVEEGAQLKKGSLVGLIDTLQLHYNREQLKASIETVQSKSTSVLSQINVLNEQLKTAKIEQTRIQNMYNENAATKRQIDEIDGKVKVIEKQISSVQTQNAPILNEIKSIKVQIEKLDDQIKKSKISNPVDEHDCRRLFCRKLYEFHQSEQLLLLWFYQIHIWYLPKSIREQQRFLFLFETKHGYIFLKPNNLLR